MKKLFKIFKKRLIPLTLTVLVVFSVLVGFWERPELLIYDSWFNLKGQRKAPQNIAIVAIDDKSIRELGLLPWPRSRHAQLLEALSKAKVVGFDIVFDTPGKAKENKVFADSIIKHGRVVLSTEFFFEGKGQNVYQVLAMPIDELAEATAGVGFVNTPEDLDNVIRRVTAIDTNTFQRPFPCLSLAVYLTDKQLNPDHLSLTKNNLLSADKLRLPLDSANQVLIDFWGPAASFKTYSYVDVLKGKFKASEFAGKIILVGISSTAEHDNKRTPFTRGNLVLKGALPTPGVEIHASAIATYQSGGFYRKASIIINLLYLFLSAALATFIVSRTRSPGKGLLLLSTLMLALILFSFGLWNFKHIWLNTAAPLFLAILVYIGITAENLVRTEFERRRTRALFARYVPPAVVDELMKHQEDIVLGGIRMELTILFSDIRGFTTFSENRQPEEIVRRLNEYFAVMTEIIFKYGGTLDKYLGDGMMAFFGAPVPFENHADRALKASLEMVDRLTSLNELWRQKGEPIMEIGVGINSGPVVVGNIGSPDRMDYTIIGGDVNLAARLESMNKEYKTQIILSERTVNYLVDTQLLSSLKDLGTTQVRGMAAPVKIYTLEYEKAPVEPFDEC